MGGGGGPLGGGGGVSSYYEDSSSLGYVRQICQSSRAPHEVRFSFVVLANDGHGTPGERVVLS